jgi:hypothetical protein
MHEEHSISCGRSIYPTRNFNALVLLLRIVFSPCPRDPGNKLLTEPGLRTGLIEKVSMYKLSIRILLFVCLSATSAAVMAVPYLSIQ